MVIVETDEGITGYGETDTNPWVVKALIQSPGTHTMDQSMKDILIGMNPLNIGECWKSLYVGTAMTGRRGAGVNAIGAIDMALWDIYGQETGIPIYKLLGGNLREEVDYFYYLQWDELDSFIKQCEEGHEKGYEVFYMKIGLNDENEEEMLRQVRSIIGYDKKIRIDVNMAWDIPKAKRLINLWHEKYKLDFDLKYYRYLVMG